MSVGIAAANISITASPAPAGEPEAFDLAELAAEVLAEKANEKYFRISAAPVLSNGALAGMRFRHDEWPPSADCDTAADMRVVHVHLGAEAVLNRHSIRNIVENIYSMAATHDGKETMGLNAAEQRIIVESLRKFVARPDNPYVTKDYPKAAAPVGC